MDEARRPRARRRSPSSSGSSAGSRNRRSRRRSRSRSRSPVRARDGRRRRSRSRSPSVGRGGRGSHRVSGGAPSPRQHRGHPRGHNGRAPKPEEFRVYVGNLAYNLREEQLRDHFSMCGKITSLTIPKRQFNPDDGQDDREGRGFAFVGFDTVDAAAQACMRTGSELAGRKISVDIATNKRPEKREREAAVGQSQRTRAAPPAQREPQDFKWGQPHPAPPEPAAAPSAEPPPGAEPPPEEKPREQPNFEVSGNLSKAERTTAGGVELKFEEPSDARKPSSKWRLYVFKNGEPMLKDDGGYYKIHRQSVYLFGRDRSVADIPTEHPSCSKQHAVLQYRKVGDRPVTPYVMDLDTINGTTVNGDRLEGRRYYELLEKDVIKFGTSTREYVLLHEGSAADEDDDGDE